MIPWTQEYELVPWENLNSDGTEDDINEELDTQFKALNECCKVEPIEPPNFDKL